MSCIRILLVDDHTILRAGLCALLALYPDLQVVGEASDGAEALAKVNECKPDVVVMDIAMRGVNGLVATRQILEAHPKTRILILTQYDSKEHVLPLLKVGAAGYLPKYAVRDDFVSAIRAVASGESFLYPSAAKMVLDAYLRDSRDESGDVLMRLTHREREVLSLVAQGLATREIAEKLHISPNTVDVHRAHLMEKLEVRNASELTAYIIHRGLEPT